MKQWTAIRTVAAALALLFLAACSSTGGRASFLRSSFFGGSDDAEEALADSVRAARAEQARAQDDFASAFRLFQRLTAPQAVELEELDGELEDSIDECDEAAEQLRERILEIRTDANALFTEWKAELEHFSGDELRKKSESMLVDTEQRSQRVVAALEKIQGKMEPVLLKFHDYELFFNHNLNPRAIATLEDTYDDFDRELGALNAEIVAAQTEMNSFLEQLEGRLSARE
jgi:hypothetical protein